MLKILQARPQQYVNRELPDVQAGFRKCRRAFPGSSGGKASVNNVGDLDSIPGLGEGNGNSLQYSCPPPKKKENAEEPEIKLPTLARSSKKQKSSRKTSISALLTMPKPLTVWITKNCGKFWKRWEYQAT